MDRPDITDDLVHFIRGDTLEDAVGVLQTILDEGMLRGGVGFIKGTYRCVCFSEAPIGYLADAVVRSTRPTRRYQPVGIFVGKQWLFECGGRPVIYQPNSEYETLPEALRWRHVRYIPTGDQPVDFTWEREWRIHADELRVDPSCARIAAPAHVAQELVDDHDADQHRRCQELELCGVMDAPQVYMWATAFPWSFEIVGP